MKSIKTPSSTLSVKRKTRTITTTEEYVEISFSVPSEILVPGKSDCRPPFCHADTSGFRERSRQWINDFHVGVGEFRPALKSCLEATRGMKTDKVLTFQYDRLEWVGIEIICKRLGISRNDWMLAWVANAAWVAGALTIPGARESESATLRKTEELMSRACVHYDAIQKGDRSPARHKEFDACLRDFTPLQLHSFAEKIHLEKDEVEKKARRKK